MRQYLHFRAQKRAVDREAISRGTDYTVASKQIDGDDIAEVTISLILNYREYNNRHWAVPVWERV